MSRYRIKDGKGWYNDYATKYGAAKALARRLDLILKEYGFYEVKPNKEVTPSERAEMIRLAGQYLSERHNSN